ncbi:hypothetical protein JTB14_019537 [Gonioctena quinquepunctata]|nr:hypothetical protein JTB14_019537 [Gonioctena quinquepunctata]
MPINCSKCFEKLKISSACENCSVPLHVKCGNRIDSDGKTNILVCTKCVDDPAAMMAKTENELNHSSSSVETIIGRDRPNDDSLNVTVLLKENLLLKQIIEQMTERIELMCFKIGVLEQKRESSPLTNRVTKVATTPEAKPSMITKIPNENGNIKSSTSNHGENKWNTVDSSGFKKKKKHNQLADRNTQDTLEVRIVDDVDVNNANPTNLNVQQKTLSAAIHEAEIAAKCNEIMNLNAGVWNKTPKTHNISGRNKPIIGKMANCSTKAIEKSCSLHVYKLKPSATSESLLEDIKGTFPEAKVEKIRSMRPDIYSSFKVDIDQSNLEKACDESVWPMGAHVNRFFWKKNRGNSDP